MELEQAGVDIMERKILSMAEAEQKAHRKSKSVQKKPAIFQRFGPMTAQENQHFEELYKKTLKDIHVANREYTQ